MAAVERRLWDCAEHARVDESFVAASVDNRLPSIDECTVAVRALAEIGILRDLGSGDFRLSVAELEQSEGYRQGVREGIALARAKTSELSGLTLLSSVPIGVPLAAEVEVRNQAADLRAAIVEIVAGAERRIVLASPFWDLDTVEELHVLLARRLEAGVIVDVLGRFLRGNDVLDALVDGLSGRGRARVFSWHSANPSDPLGSQSFHFKAAVADDGALAYVGSANFTISGLRSRMELGVLLRHEPALRVSRILDTVIGFSDTVAVLGAP